MYADFPLAHTDSVETFQSFLSAIEKDKEIDFDISPRLSSQPSSVTQNVTPNVTPITKEENIKKE